MVRPTGPCIKQQGRNYISVSLAGTLLAAPQWWLGARGLSRRSGWRWDRQECREETAHSHNFGLDPDQVKQKKLRYKEKKIPLRMAKRGENEKKRRSILHAVVKVTDSDLGITLTSSSTITNPSNLQNLERCMVNSQPLRGLFRHLHLPFDTHVNTHTLVAPLHPFPFLMRASRATTSRQWGTSIMSGTPFQQRGRRKAWGGVFESICVWVGLMTKARGQNKYLLLIEWKQMK